MNWQDDRLGLQVERALTDVRLTRGCELEIFIHDGIIELGAQLANETELAAVIEALMFIPGVLVSPGRLIPPLLGRLEPPAQDPNRFLSRMPFSLALRAFGARNKRLRHRPTGRSEPAPRWLV